MRPRAFYTDMFALPVLLMAKPSTILKLTVKINSKTFKKRVQLGALQSTHTYSTRVVNN